MLQLSQATRHIGDDPAEEDSSNPKIKSPDGNQHNHQDRDDVKYSLCSYSREAEIFAVEEQHAKFKQAKGEDTNEVDEVLNLNTQSARGHEAGCLGTCLLKSNLLSRFEEQISVWLRAGGC